MDPVTVNVAEPKSPPGAPVAVIVYMPAVAAAPTVNVPVTVPSAMLHETAVAGNAGALLSAQVRSAGSNCDPVTVTMVPRGPEVGDNVTILGRTVKIAVAVSLTAPPVTVMT